MPDSFMEIALKAAEQAAMSDEVPVGAVLVHNQQVVAIAGNKTITHNDPSAHAEMLAIREGCRQMGSQRLPDCDLYVTLEPCTMCAAAISFARIRRLYFAAEDKKGGAVQNGIRFFQQPTCHHTPEVYSGIGEQAAQKLLKGFFIDRR